MAARSHPTLRPHALALGVLAPALGDAALSSAVPVDRLYDAFWRDTLRGLVTFPLRSRVFLVRDEADVARVGPSLPPGWKAVAHPTATGVAGPSTQGSSARSAQSRSFTELYDALETLLLPGIEAGLVVCADAPSLPIGEIFDALLWMAQTARAGVRRVTLGLTPDALTSDALTSDALTSDALTSDAVGQPAAGSVGLYAAGSAQTERSLFARGGVDGLAGFEASAAAENVEVRRLSKRVRVVDRASLEAAMPELLTQGTTDAGKLLRELRGVAES